MEFETLRSVVKLIVQINSTVLSDPQLGQPCNFTKDGTFIRGQGAVSRKTRHTGEQMAHWDMLNKENSNWWLSLTCPSAYFALQYGDFVPRDCSAAKGHYCPKRNLNP